MRRGLKLGLGKERCGGQRRDRGLGETRREGRAQLSHHRVVGGTKGESGGDRASALEEGADGRRERRGDVVDELREREGKERDWERALGGRRRKKGKECVTRGEGKQGGRPTQPVWPRAS